jgi:hypothetical protein
MEVGKRLLYEIDTANRVLPLVRAIVRDVVNDFRVLRGAGRQQRALQAHHDGDTRTLDRIGRLSDQVDEVSSRIEGYLRELEELGIELRDLETGSVDFPTIMNGLPAFLCWRLGEEEVAWWHAASTGYADRQRLPERVRSGLTLS